jgi:hypothetical protein
VFEYVIFEFGWESIDESSVGAVLFRTEVAAFGDQLLESGYCLTDLLIDVFDCYTDLTRTVLACRGFWIRGKFGGFEPAQPTGHV